MVKKIVSSCKKTVTSRLNQLLLGPPKKLRPELPGSVPGSWYGTGFEEFSTSWFWYLVPFLDFLVPGRFLVNPISVTLYVDTLRAWSDTMVTEVKRIGSSLAKHTTGEESEVIKHLVLRVAVVLARVNTSMILNRVPVYAST